MAEKNKTVLVLILILCSLKGLFSYSSRTRVRSEQLIESMEFGEINWTGGLLTVEAREELPPAAGKRSGAVDEENPGRFAGNLAEARSMARSLAMEKAGRHLYNAVLHVRIKNSLLVKDHISRTTNDFPSVLQEFISRNKRTKHLYNKDGSVSARMSIELFGENGLISLFYGAAGLFQADGSSALSTLRDRYKPKPDEVKQKFSSLIVDAGHIREIEPALFPLLCDETNTVLYSPLFCPEGIKKSGYVSYLPSLSCISNLPYYDAGSFTVKALALYDRTDLILPRERMSRFFSDPETQAVLGQCRVVIIIHP